MEIKELKNLILSNKVPELIIFDVIEPTLARQYIDKISDTTNKHPKFYDSAEEVIVEISTNLREDFLFIIYNDEKIFKNEDYLQQLKRENRNVILYFSSIDRKTSFYKNHIRDIVSFEKLDRLSILVYLQKRCKENKVEIDQDKLLSLIDYCDCDLGCVINEIDKIFTLHIENSNLLVDYMMNNGFSDYRKTNIYNFVNKIMKKDISVLEDYQKIDSSVVSLMYLIYTTARNYLIRGGVYSYYGDIISKSINIYNSIIDGSMSSDYALKHFLCEVFCK